MIYCDSGALARLRPFGHLIFVNALRTWAYTTENRYTNRLHLTLPCIPNTGPVVATYFPLVGAIQTPNLPHWACRITIDACLVWCARLLCMDLCTPTWPTRGRLDPSLGLLSSINVNQTLWTTRVCRYERSGVFVTNLVWRFKRISGRPGRWNVRTGA